MEPSDLTVQILREIRDAVRETNVRVDQTNVRLEETRSMMEEKFDILAQRIVESEIRTATAITGLGGALDQVKNLLMDRLDLRDRVDRCERDISLLKDHAGI